MLEGSAMSALVPHVRAVMGRRILVNFRVRPEVLARHVPRPFRVKEVRGWGMAGICLIRLESTRVRGFPAFLGLTSENAAHRIAVQWDDALGVRDGVFIPRRDTGSWVNRWAGGWLFPGVHGAARFVVRDEGGRLEVAMRSEDGKVVVRVEAEEGTEVSWPEESVFPGMLEASQFFRSGCCGWSPTADGSGFEGIELVPDAWTLAALSVRTAESSYFSDPGLFPRGSVELDSAMLMRGIPHTWRDLGRMDIGGGAVRGIQRVPRGLHGVSGLFRMP